MNVETQSKIVPINLARQQKVRRAMTARKTEQDPPPGTAQYWALRMIAIAERSDRSAFQEIFDYYGPRIKSFLIKNGQTAGFAEEIAQETLLTVWHKADRFNPALASVSTWIFTIARNKKIDRLRKDSRPLPDVNDPSFSRSGDVCPEKSAWHSINANKVHVALSKLPADQRQVLAMAFIEDKAHARISETLGIPLGTVKSRIRIGMNKLRSLLAEQSGDFR